MPDYQISHDRSRSFFPVFTRKSELQHQTHYCPGCGHGIAHKLLAKAIDDLGIQDRVIMVSPVGCSVFAYYYFDVGNVQVAHGRAPAAATGIKRSRPESIVISYQGDGDLAAIGTAEILHAANRGEPITVVFVNNAIYGMTGGQLAPTTPLGQKTTTSPYGRNIWNEGYPLHVCEVLAALDAPVYLERVALGNNKQVMQAAKAVKKGLDNQVKGLGFSLIEILSPCPTIWKMQPVEAQKRIENELTRIYPLGVFRDLTKEALPRPKPTPRTGETACPTTMTPVLEEVGQAVSTASLIDMHIKIAGFGGQGVLMLGEVLAEAGLDAGLEVSWLPSYGPEMRSGTSNCHVRLSSRPVDSPVVTRPNVLMAMNEPSLHKFLDSVEPGGWVFYNGTALPADTHREDLNFVVKPFSQIADELGEVRATNIVMLGALLEATGILEPGPVDEALHRLVKSERWLAVDRRALEHGRGVFHEIGSRCLL